jgi:outer membrane biogenesis lipoprotein LolB
MTQPTAQPHTTMNFRHHFLALLFSALLAACGGGTADEPR